MNGQSYRSDRKHKPDWMNVNEAKRERRDRCAKTLTSWEEKMGHAAKQMIKYMQGNAQDVSIRIRIPHMLSPEGFICLSVVTHKKQNIFKTQFD